MHTRSLVVLTGALMFAGAPAFAATCLVDVGGALGIPGAFASTNAALAACPSPATIEIRCAAGGCTDTNVVVNARSGVTITSSELTGLGGPVSLVGVMNQPALQVINNSSIVVSGIASFSAPNTAVWVNSSQLTFEAVAALPVIWRYTTFSGGSTALLIEGGSVVTATRVGFNDSFVGISMLPIGNSAPTVRLTGAAFLRNGIAAQVSGPMLGCVPAAGPRAVLELRGDTVGWLNYVFDNHEGFHLHGRASLLLDHGVLANNLDQIAGPFNNAYLFHLEDASLVEVRNALIYDNDATPALTGPWAGGANTASIIYTSTSCAPSRFVASTIVNNAADLVFNIGGNGLLTLDHVAIAGNWGKVLSMSGYYVNHGNTCPPLTLLGATVWNNAVAADPAQCLPTTLIGWNPNAVPNNPPRTLVAYPTIVAPATANHLIRRLEPLASSGLPVGLYVGRPWSVNGIVDESDNVLDVGFHNPR